MTPLPSMQTLRAFDAAARHGSYSVAAAELGVTHGAVSHRIRELEERLQTPLFRRSNRRMVPTREAVALLSQVRQALATLDRAFPAPAPARSVRLVVSVHPSLAVRWLVPRLGRFTAAHPAVDLEVRSTADLDDFLDPGVDLALRYGAGGWADAVDERLSGEVLFPVCAPAYRDQLCIREPADLARCVLLRHAWQPWSPWLREARLRLEEPRLGPTLSDSAMIVEAAASGQGVALARRLFVQGDLASGRLVRLFDVEVEDAYAYHIAWRAGSRLGEASLAFAAWLRAELAPG
ncbi:LysR substrate-binding domain-containing protein [Caulobacter sp. S45]|uniref:LysR substrate-binding domain-containing protein n=1 Tax=Caulobacter sp. S45 TaxID=1641861 RepID=UPI001574F88A|nr:LysR substrate-binding domain-containing protein [Caulobacter sp. S45]